ncbi:hypothetical protein ZIOFF_070037 [Zingiber officinale]|uniref:Uncharacterized protein n=1 Tax=Zingiber officinale TaxID=94328 RepID=A0A8J5CWE7_ZINOF|nr:hypothetical protein ZIOFF_070037 [Zingiber officinale]
MKLKGGKKSSSSLLHYEAPLPLGYSIEDFLPHGGINKFQSVAYSNFMRKPSCYSFLYSKPLSCPVSLLIKVEADQAFTNNQIALDRVKRDYVEGIGDILDLVLIGAWHGNRRKAGWYSPFIVACYNPDTEEFQSVCHVMSSFSDSFYLEVVNNLNCFYYSVDNLYKDIFLCGKMDGQGWVPVSLSVTFNMVSQKGDHEHNGDIICSKRFDRTWNTVEKIRRREDWMRWLLPSMENPNGHGSTPHLTLNHDDSAIHPMQPLRLEESSSQATMSHTQTEVALDRGSASCSCNSQ